MKHIKKSLTILLAAALLAAFLAPGIQAAEKPVRIAFIDSGISTKHIDRFKVAEGCNYVFPESDTSDRVGHGTATAGLVLGAADQDVPGVYPDAIAVPLVVVDVYPSGAVKNGGPEALTQAIYDAVDRFDCQIINMSLCTAEDSEELRAAVDYAEKQGVVLISAIGNEGESDRTYYPAAYETVVAVGSADGDGVADFSQSGADLLTAGVGLLTATNSNGKTPATVQGTSYSCALVSGVCARLLAKNPEMSPEDVRNALFARAEDILEPGFDARSGWGILPVEFYVPDTGSSAPETPAEQTQPPADRTKNNPRWQLLTPNGSNVAAQAYTNFWSTASAAARRLP